MLLHCVSLEHEDVSKEYSVIRNELQEFDAALLGKEEWIILTKSDLSSAEHSARIQEILSEKNDHVYVVSAETGEGIKELQDALVAKLRK